MKSNFQEHRQLHWFAFQNAKASTASAGRWLLHSVFVGVECCREAVSEQWTPKHFQAREKGGLTRIGKPPPLTSSLGKRESRGQSPKRRACPQETTVWRKDGGAVTCPVLKHFQGIERLLLDFMMLTNVSWLTRVHRHLNRSREGRERLASGLPLGSPTLTHHLPDTHSLTKIGSENWTSVRLCWPPLPGYHEILSFFPDVACADVAGK